MQFACASLYWTDFYGTFTEHFEVIVIEENEIIVRADKKEIDERQTREQQDDVDSDFIAETVSIVSVDANNKVNLIHHFIPKHN